MKVKKKSLIIITILTSLFLFQTTISPVFSYVDTTNTDLTIWYTEDEGLDDTLLNLIDEFESEQGITVSVVQKTVDELREGFKMKYDESDGPDLIQAPADLIGEFAILGAILPLNNSDLEDKEFFSKALYSVSYYEVSDGAVTSNIKYYGFPQYVDAPALIYNIDKFSSNVPPSTSETWTNMEMKESLVKANDQSNPNPDLKQFGFAFLDTYLSPEAVFSGAGGHFFTDYTVDRTHLVIDYPESVQGMEFLYDLGYTYRLMAPFDKISYFENGLYGFSEVGNISSVFGLARNLKSILEGDVFSDSSKLGIAPIGMNENGTAGNLAVTALMINSQTDKKTEAINLAKYLTSESAMLANYENEYLLPAVSNLYSDSELKSDPIANSFKELIDKSNVIPVSQYTYEIKGIKSSEFTKLLLGNQDGQKTCTALGLKLSVIIPSNAPIEPIKYVETVKKGIPGYSAILLLSLAGFSTLRYLFSKKRRIN